MKLQLLTTLLLAGSMVTSCYNTQRCDAYGWDYSSQKNGGFQQTPSGNNGSIIDGVTIQQHIPTKRLIAYEYVHEADGFVFDKNGKLTASELNDLGQWELWKDLNKEQFIQFTEEWKMSYLNRISVFAKNAEGKPLNNVAVRLFSGETILWSGKTDNRGHAQIWFGEDSLKQSKLEFEFNGMIKTSTNVKTLNEGINFATFQDACSNSDEIDIAFMVDATSSMSDEINFLKQDLMDIAQQIKAANSDLSLKMGSVFYRCKNNSYETKQFPMTDNIASLMTFIQEQDAEEGGDESVDVALLESLTKLKWRKDARARLLFILLDEPPETTPEIAKNMQKAYRIAAEKGIKIIPIVSSNMGFSSARRLEYLMRCASLATNGTYVFLTDDSGIGSGHVTPYTSSITTRKLNELMLEIINRYSYENTCKIEPQPIVQDTIAVSNNLEVVNALIDSLTFFRNDSLIALNILPFTTYENIDSLKSNRPLESIDTSSFLAFHRCEVPTMKIYPNPSRGHFIAEFSNVPIEIVILDGNGRLIQYLTLEDRTSIPINLNDYPDGYYFIRATIGKHSLQSRLQKIGGG